MSNSALLEGRGALVLHDLDPGAVAHDLDPVLDGLDAADVEAHRRVELERPAAGGGLRRAEHHADLLAQLVDEDGDGAGPVEVGGQLAQRLGHEAGLEADVGVAHLALDLGPGRERGHRVDGHHVDGARAHEHVGDLERLLARVGLGDEQLVDVDADGPGVHRVERVLGVDVGADAPVALGLGHDVQGERGLARRLGPVDLGDAAPGQAADAERQVEGQGTGRHGLDGHAALLAHLHDRALAELLLDLTEGHLEVLLSIHRCGPFCGGADCAVAAGRPEAGARLRSREGHGAPPTQQKIKTGCDTFGDCDAFGDGAPYSRNDTTVVSNACSFKDPGGIGRQPAGIGRTRRSS